VKRLPLGIQNFKEIIEGSYVYVDKTQHIYNLVNGAKYCFLSRPRRFGKSLLLDTIAEAFKGAKGLFKGLWIYNSDYAFNKHPVVRLDMSNMANKTPDALEESISFNLKLCYEAEGFDYRESIVSNAFMKLILLLYAKYGERVVILIDEYDKPILDHIDDIGAADRNRKALSGFYGVMKSMDPYLRFVFITGVTKFTKTSVFSGLNNLKDITMADNYAEICGIPVNDLEVYFSEHIGQMSAHKRLSKIDGVKNEILAWYDGYSWDGESRLLNPFSLFNSFDDKKFKRYWYETGTPTFLINIIKRKPESYLNLKNHEMTEDMLDTFEIEKIEPEPLLFQTGYLTVKEASDVAGSPVYILDIPNYEVRDAFSMQMVSALTECGDIKAGRAKMQIGAALESGDLQKMLDILRGLFASIPYELHVKQEAYYHSIFYAVMTLLGFDMDAEVSVSRGRVDAILELEDKIYIMEFKYVNCPAEASADDKKRLFDSVLNDAMIQINEKGYCDKYRGSGKTVFKTAFAFLGRDDIEMRAEPLVTE